MLIRSMVAGSFYPEDPKILQASIKKMLNATVGCANLPIPKAIIAPHAGYIYSGPITSSGYACLVKAKNRIKKVVILAPAHQYLLSGIATTLAVAYETPLGQIKIDQQTIRGLNFSFLNVTEQAFRDEHSIEVHLPFLQVVLGEFLLIPLLIGKANKDQTSEILETLWGAPDTLIVVSSDLSHYHSYEKAKILDGETAKAITELNSDKISTDDACGATAIQGLLKVVAKKKMHVKQLDLRNSGDTSGDKDRVVGYGAFHFN